MLERVKGIEPSYLAWKATALPLSYTRARRKNRRSIGANHHAPPLPVKSALFSRFGNRQTVHTTPDLLQPLINELAPFRPT